MFRRPEVCHRPKIEKREGYRYCSSKGEEKGVQYTFKAAFNQFVIQPSVTSIE